MNRTRELKKELAQFLYEFLAVFGVFDKPAEQFNFVTEGVASRPVPVCTCLGPLFKERSNLLSNGFLVFVQLQYPIDSFPPIQKRCRLTRRQFAIIDQAVCFPNLIK